jgi:hypothetical protein
VNQLVDQRRSAKRAGRERLKSRKLGQSEKLPKVRRLKGPNAFVDDKV